MSLKYRGSISKNQVPADIKLVDNCSGIEPLGYKLNWQILELDTV